MAHEAIQAAIINAAADIVGERAQGFNAETKLVGDAAVLKSRELVELLLNLEEYCEDELGVEFNWQNDAAMSQRRSAFRTIGSLAEYIGALKAEAGA
jgi:acyl carrier protein